MTLAILCPAWAMRATGSLAQDKQGIVSNGLWPVSPPQDHSDKPSANCDPSSAIRNPKSGRCSWSRRLPAHFIRRRCDLAFSMTTLQGISAGWRPVHYIAIDDASGHGYYRPVSFILWQILYTVLGGTTVPAASFNVLAHAGTPRS